MLLKEITRRANTLTFIWVFFFFCGKPMMNVPKPIWVMTLVNAITHYFPLLLFIFFCIGENNNRKCFALTLKAIPKTRSHFNLTKHLFAECVHNYSWQYFLPYHFFFDSNIYDRKLAHKTKVHSIRWIVRLQQSPFILCVVTRDLFFFALPVERCIVRYQTTNNTHCIEMTTSK